LYEFGLVPAIRNLVAGLYEDRNLSISLHFAHEHVFLSNTTKIILYRVIRELLINILKHSQANNVEISGVREGKTFKVVIVDDGIGCDVRNSLNDSSSGDCLGLFLIRERMWHIGGSFTFESTRGGGTKAMLVAPLAEPRKPMEQ
jgi:signal transduction histidine kinase